jgi:hypothetical protein
VKLAGPVLVVGCGWISHQVHLPLLAGMRANGQIGELWVTDLDRAVAARTAWAFDARLAKHGEGGLLSWLRAAGLPATRGGREAGVLWGLGSHLVETGLHVTGWLLDNGIAAAGETDPAESPCTGQALWQNPAGDPGEVAWCGVEGRVTTPEGHAVCLRAYWSSPQVTQGETRVHVVGAGGGSLTLGTLFSWSPHRQSAPEPALCSSGTRSSPRSPIRARTDGRRPCTPRGPQRGCWRLSSSASLSMHEDRSE